MPTREPKTPDWLIERLAQGELPAEVAAGVRARLAAEGRSADEEIAARAASDSATLAHLAPADVAAEVRRRAAQAGAAPVRRRTPWLVGGSLVTAGALAALVLVVRAAPSTSSGDTALEPTTIKGTRVTGARLFVYQHGAGGDRRLNDGARVARGDLLQLAYATSDTGFGVLLSIDGSGVVTQHWPEPGARVAAPLRSGGEVRLPSAYELDDAPAFERFFLVSADRPFQVAPIVAAARTLSSRSAEARRALLPVPSGFNQVSLALEKPAPSKESR